MGYSFVSSFLNLTVEGTLLFHGNAFIERYLALFKMPSTGLFCRAMGCRYLGLAGNDVQIPAIAPFPEEPTTAVIAVSVGGPGVQMAAGYSIVRTAGQGKAINRCNK